jgi:hypothetical protein
MNRGGGSLEAMAGKPVRSPILSRFGRRLSKHRPLAHRHTRPLLLVA